MKKKANRLDAIKMIISSKEVGSQEELLQELNREGFELTQATLSRDLKQLKVAKAASMNGKYVYVLPNNIMYKRSTDQSALQCWEFVKRNLIDRENGEWYWSLRADGSLKFDCFLTGSFHFCKERGKQCRC